jgi:transketolase
MVEAAKMQKIASPTLNPSIPTLTIEDLIFANQEKSRKREDKDRVSKDEMVISCLRSLAMDAVQEANSGHPGTPMAMAPVAYSLWANVLMYDPLDATWPNRDRFVLSMGHASMLIYGLLHVAGVREEKDGTRPAVSLEDIKQFRQLNSRCPGHPEYGWTVGVEMTTGPLGQGVATSVGMAIASKWQQAKFNKPNFELFNYNVYALCGDGCLQEGVAHEAASLAGHLKLDNLCWIWDNNRITIEGNTAWSISEDIATRFISYGWNVLRVGDANNVEALTRAFLGFQREKERPTFIVVDSHIAWGAPTKQDTFTAHGTPLGEAEVSATKAIYNWPDEKFLVPEQATEHLQSLMAARGGRARKAWEQKLEEYRRQHFDDHRNLVAMLSQNVPDGWDRFLKEFPADPKGQATRQSSATVLNQVGQGIPWLIGGSADLAPSCLTTLKFEDAGNFMPPSSQWGDYLGRNCHFGIREHAMGSIMNGLALSKLRPFGSTFLVFSDYMRPPIRISAIMEVPTVYIFTHDSIGVGEDGPTHQPIEQLASLRTIPGLYVFRPCDANEVLEMWRFIAPQKDDPVAVVLSRQAVPTLDRSKYKSASGLAHGGYIIADCPDTEVPDLILLASGSEVGLMLQAHDVLVAEGKKVRSVSMPCIELFKHQPQEYIDSVLPSQCRARVSIEAGRRASWDTFIGLDGEHIGMITFGGSGTLKDVWKEFGFTVEAVVEAAKRTLEKKPRQISSRADVVRAWKRRKVA